MSKRILSLVLALVMVLGSVPFAFAAESDVPEQIQWLVDNGYVLGDEGGLRLNDTIRRAEVAVVVAKALGLEEAADAAKNVQGAFKDVTPTNNFHWANGYINVLAGKGVVNGYPDGTFKPANNITVQEVATIMVMAIDGKAPEGTWPFNMIVRATELGLFDGVNAANYAVAATRHDTFMMIYNAINTLQMGDHDIVKAIVLENNRVEKLDENEIVIEVIEEVQRSKFAEESRDIEGAQYNLVLPEKFDAENLLGKVADFTIKGEIKDGKEVLEVKVDETYKYVEGEITKATKSKLELDEDVTYTVELPERYKDTSDERIFRTYHNNKAYTYTDFVEKVETADYARVTVKNGKVLFIDAYTFEDVAPVLDVDDTAIYVRDDKASAHELKIKLKDIDYVINVENGKFSVGDKEEIAENDVVHYYDDTFIVRKDAKVTDVFKKVRVDKVEGVQVTKIYLEDSEDPFELSYAEGRKAIYTYDYKDFEVIESRRPTEELDDFVDEEVVVLLDMFDKVQFIGAELPDTDFYALINDILGKEVELAKEDGTTAVYTVTFDSELEALGENKTIKEARLKDFNEGELVLVSVNDDDEIKSMKAIDGKTYNVAEINKDEITFKEDVNNKRFLRDTVIFIDNGDTRKGVTLEELFDKYELTVDDDSDAAVADLTAKLFKDHDVVVLNAKEKESHEYVYVKVDYIDKVGTTKYVIEAYDTEGESHEYVVDKKSDAYGKIDTIERGDVVKLKLTKGDDSKVADIEKVLVDASEHPVFAVKSIDSKNGTITLEDVHGNTRVVYRSRSEKVFDGPLYKGDHVQVGETPEEYTYIKYISVTTKDVNGEFKPGNDDDDGTVTYIDASVDPITNTFKIEVDGKVYTIDNNTVIRNEIGVIEGTTASDVHSILTGLTSPQVFDVVANGRVISEFKYVAKDADRTAAKDVIDEINALAESNDLATHVPNARSSYAALTAVQKRLVPSSVLAKLVKEEAKLAVAAAKAVLAIGYQGSDSATSVTQNLTLPTSDTDVKITWASSNKNVIDVTTTSGTGAVTRPSFETGDVEVILTATITADNDPTVKDTVTFTVKVIKLAQTDLSKATEAAQALEIVYATGDSAGNVTQNLTLPSAPTPNPHGASVTWVSSNTTVISVAGTTGTVTRPVGQDIEVTLTATVTVGSDSVTKTFTVIVKGL